MIVAVDEFGALLKKRQNRFVLSVGDKKQVANGSPEKEGL